MARQIFGFLGLVLVSACGGSPAEGSPLSTSGGSAAESSGGMPQIILPGGGGSTAAGAGGSLSTGGTGGTGFQPRECPLEPDASCPTKVLDSYRSGTMSASMLQGVTEVTGSVEISNVSEIAALDCLRTVGGDLEVDFFGADASGPVSLWPLRNLRAAGGSVSISPWSVELWVDCGLKYLQSLGEQYLTGGAVEVSGRLRGELDLSYVQRVTHIRIQGSRLTKVILPSNAALQMGQLFFRTNQELSSVDGFQAITLTQSSIQIAGAKSLSIMDNPSLSTCRANELKAIFVAAGFSEASMEIGGNLGDCP